MARKAELNGAAFEPTISASTQNLGDWVEIRIRDNGTGIPPGVMERLFDPFFTTKPAGEGTGLGLSLSHFVLNLFAFFGGHDFALSSSWRS